MNTILPPLVTMGILSAVASNTHRLPISNELLERARFKAPIESIQKTAPAPRINLETKTKWSKEELLDLVGNSCARWGVPASLGKAVATIESSLNPNAKSPVGAIGLMQIMPKTALSICKIKDKKKLLNPVINAECGCEVLATELHQWREPIKALKSYNGGYKCAKGGCKESDSYAPKVLLARNEYIE